MNIGSKEISWLVVIGAALTIHILLIAHVNKNPDVENHKKKMLHGTCYQCDYKTSIFQF